MLAQSQPHVLSYCRASTTLQINAHYLPNHVPRSHQLPLPVNQSFEVLAANLSSFTPNPKQNHLIRSP